MNKIIPVLFLALAICYLSSCEKDDICVDSDTPLLVIGFFDVEDTLVSKNVSLLRVRALGFDTSPDTFTDRSNSLDSIGIPLQIDTTSTSYVFITDSEDDDEGNETGNIDTLSFDYVLQEVFVSRACGFVGNFEGLTETLQTDSDNWIQNIQIVTPNIENSGSIHVKIFH
ncbi:MAG: DUF6452 family protein [Bacteroidota bacterium]